MAGIAFVLLVLASWFVAASELESSDQTAQVIARDLPVVSMSSKRVSP